MATKVLSHPLQLAPICDSARTGECAAGSFYHAHHGGDTQVSSEVSGGHCFFQHAHEPIRRGPESWFLYRFCLKIVCPFVLPIELCLRSIFDDPCTSSGVF